MPGRACRNCRFISNSNVCPNCKSTSLSNDWVGELIVIDPERSVVARNLKIRSPGHYALLVR
ncbi:MAG: transcription elongation factor subunit Spt4 [Candidatus Bathyarchaeia archaeon]